MGTVGRCAANALESRERRDDMKYDESAHIKPSLISDVEITPAMIAAAKRAIAKKKERAGLFAEEIDDDPEALCRARKAGFTAEFRERAAACRDLQAKIWRQARKLLFSFPSGVRRALRSRWNGEERFRSCHNFSHYVDQYAIRIMKRAAGIPEDPKWAELVGPLEIEEKK